MQWSNVITDSVLKTLYRPLWLVSINALLWTGAAGCVFGCGLPLEVCVLLPLAYVPLVFNILTVALLYTLKIEEKKRVV